MGTYSTLYLYTLNQNGNSNTGSITGQVPNSSAQATEGVDDGVATVNETFSISFNDPGTGATYDGTYTYLGHSTGISGFIGQGTDGNYYLFSNDPSLANGTTLSHFTAENLALCFLPGTLIATPGGARAVEDLTIGDPVLTADGRTIPVKWMGRQTISTFFGFPEARRPVLVEAGALGQGLPLRDLRLTADHALLIDGLLVNAGALVNGTTIRHLSVAEMGERLVVHHIETEGHEVILAEGCAAETFVDYATRAHFDNYAEYLALYGEPADVMEALEAPRVKGRRQLPATLWARIDGQAAATRREIDAAA
ncbi:Hint domain-containing protein [Roseococcus sp. YIM B11640]|uniref:Hint domain-containing protein n=1 Tax=Roseococcus sp. YIM B11640 TaxID=3133973 RepID=UPI003C7E0057